jgi:hypothetical protein
MESHICSHPSTPAWLIPGLPSAPAGDPEGHPPISRPGSALRHWRPPPIHLSQGHGGERGGKMARQPRGQPLDGRAIPSPCTILPPNGEMPVLCTPSHGAAEHRASVQIPLALSPVENGTIVGLLRAPHDPRSPVWRSVATRVSGACHIGTASAPGSKRDNGMPKPLLRPHRSEFRWGMDWVGSAWPGELGSHVMEGYHR